MATHIGETTTDSVTQKRKRQIAVAKALRAKGVCVLLKAKNASLRLWERRTLRRNSVADADTATHPLSP